MTTKEDEQAGIVVRIGPEQIKLIKKGGVINTKTTRVLPILNEDYERVAQVIDAGRYKQLTITASIMQTDEQAAEKWIESTSDYCVWGKKDYEGYPCPHCSRHPKQAFLAGIQHERSKSGWVSVKDQLPPDDLLVLVSQLTREIKIHRPAIGQYYNSAKIWDVFGYHYYEVAFWREIPEPPKGE